MKIEKKNTKNSLKSTEAGISHCQENNQEQSGYQQTKKKRKKVNGSLNQSIIRFIEKNTLIKPGDSIIIGLSGGADSVFLLHTLVALREQWHLALTATHLDHEGRESSSDDAAFCEKLCTELAVSIVVKKISALKHTPPRNGSQEAWWRASRRLFFEEVRCAHNADSIALGHHQQDQIETFLIRLMRGASLTGLVGMQPKSGHYIRPLLATTQQEIQSSLEQHGIAYCTDVSNTDMRFLRNRIRHQVLPALRTCDDRFDANAINALKRLQGAEQVLETITRETFAQLSCATDKNSIAVEKLQALPGELQYRVIMLWLCHASVPFTPSQALLDEIRRFLFASPGRKHTLYARWDIVKDQQHARIELP